MLIEVSNMNRNLIEADVRRLFTPYGEVASVQVIRDRHNNRPSGRAHVLMPVERQARAALVSLHGLLWAGKSIHLTEITDNG